MPNFSLSSRLVLICLLAAVLPLTMLAAYLMHAFESTLREMVLANLEIIADKKAAQVEQFMQERQNAVSRLAASTVVREAIERGELGEPPAAARLRTELAPFVDEDSFIDILLTDEHGRVIFSQRDASDAYVDLRAVNQATTPYARAVERALASGMIQFGQFSPYPPSGSWAAFIVKPVQVRGHTIGTLAVRLDAARLQAVAGERTGLGQTGETLLGQRDSRGSYYTGPLRHASDAAFRLPVPASEDVSMHRALAREHGRGLMMDYAGHEVVAAWRFLPLPGWGMAIKIDTAEALAPAAALRRATWSTVGLALLLATVAAYLLGTRLTRPIRTLTRTAGRIAAGDFSGRASVEGCDETARLAHAFNSMSDALASARDGLETQVMERSQALREALMLQSAILDNAGALVVVLDREGRIRRFNRASETLSQYSFAEVEGRFLWDILLPPEDAPTRRERFQALVKNPAELGETHISRWRARDGSLALIEWRNGVVHDAMGQFNLLVSIGVDITEKTRAEASSRLYANVFTHSGEAILITDSEHRIVAANPAFVAMSGYQPEEMLGRTPTFLASGHTPAETYEAMRSELQETGHWQGEIVNRHKDGTLYPKWMAVSIVQDEQGHITHYVASYTDIAARERAAEQISQLAYQDALTGLSNRFSLQGQLDQALAMARREQRLVAVMFLDLDKFKTINDTLGHAIGDIMLQTAARRLRETVRESDIVSRLGGDEFVVVLTELGDLAAATQVGEKILDTLRQPYIIDGHTLQSSASLGIALFPDDGSEADTLLKRADAAMYHAKSQGRDALRFFRPEMDAAAEPAKAQ